MHYFKRFGLAFSLIFVLLILSFLSPINAVLKPSAVKQANEKSIGAWMPYWDKTNVDNSFQKGKNLLNEISPYWYFILPNGQLRPTSKFDLAMIKEARQNGMKIIPMVSNGYNGQLVSQIIRNQKLRKKHIDALLNIAIKRKLDGIELDYEGLLPQDRSKFANFVKILATKLHEHDKLLSVTLQAKTSEPGKTNSTKAQDWKKIGTYADMVRIMAYDYHWKTSPPGPIAPINWIEEIAQLAQKTLPPQKTVLAIGTYGYDWRSGRAQPITLPQAKALAKKHKKRIIRDPKSKELYLKLVPGKAQIWLQDSGSLRLKLRIIKKYNLAGAYFWRLGNEDSEHWKVLRSELR